MRASTEVIVSGGTINSPNLLHISGVGPADHLRKIGVDVVHDLPGVGENYSDHYTVRISRRAKRRGQHQPAFALPQRSCRKWPNGW